jgi:tRNA (guanosine-2'-O-)-methyltransferase
MNETNFTNIIVDNVEDNMENKKRHKLREKANNISNIRCNTLICVLEDPSNMQNVGTVIRNINALGVSKLYIVDNKNIFSGRSWEEMRTSASLNNTSVSAIKWTFVKTFKTSQECFDHLEKKNFVSFGTSPHIKGKDNVLLDKSDFTQKKIAIWFGNETNGMSEYAVDKCTKLIQIPMAGIIESYNLATSTGIVLYEICKQRRNFHKK